VLGTSAPRADNTERENQPLIRFRTAAVTATLALALTAIAATAATPPTSFKGTTAQGQSIVVQFVPNGTNGVIKFKTSVDGQCPMAGYASVKMSQGVADSASGPFPTPPTLFWDHKQPTYEIYFKLKGLPSGHKLTGVLRVSWRTNIDNVPKCEANNITWTATR
jgi:hypothetical protein